MEMRKNKKLRALYYPYSRCLNEDTLKRSLLIFDELWFIDPLSENTRDSLKGEDGPIQCYFSNLDSALLELWRIIKEKYELLLEKGIVKYYDLGQITNKYDHLLTQGLASDIHDNSFWKICHSNPEDWLLEGLRPQFLRSDWAEEQRKKMWIIPIDRLPASILNAFSLHSPDRYSDTFISSINSPKFNSDVLKVKLDIEEESGAEICWRGEKFIAFPFVHGSSLYLNQALIVSEEENLIPFTDSAIHHQLLLGKYERAVANPEKPVQKILTERSPIDSQKFNLLALNILNILIPPEELEMRSLEDILRYREECSESLHRFQTYLFALHSRIEGEPWSDKFHKEIIKIIDGEVVPKGQNLQEEMKGIYEKLFRRVLQNLTATVTPTFVTTIFTGLSSGQILTLSCAAIATAFSISMPELLNTWQNKRDLNKNSLAFLLKFNPHGRRS